MKAIIRSIRTAVNDSPLSKHGGRERSASTPIGTQASYSERHNLTGIRMMALPTCAPEPVSPGAPPPSPPSPASSRRQQWKKWDNAWPPTHRSRSLASKPVSSPGTRGPPPREKPTSSTSGCYRHERHEAWPEEQRLSRAMGAIIGHSQRRHLRPTWCLLGRLPRVDALAMNSLRRPFACAVVSLSRIQGRRIAHVLGPLPSCGTNSLATSKPCLRYSGTLRSLSVSRQMALRGGSHCSTCSSR